MVRANRAPSFVEATWRLLAPALVVVLALSVDALAPAPVEADSSASVALIRARQVQMEAAMRRADGQIERLLRERRNHAKLLGKARQKLEKAAQRRDAARRRDERAQARLDELKLTLARKVRVRPDPRGTQSAAKPALRKRVRQLEQQVRQLDRKLRQAERRVEQARALKQSRWSKPAMTRIDKRKAERERAEGLLGSAIESMLSLSMARANGMGLAAGSALRRPSGGRISQPFGCTGYPVNPRRGSCRHFHDGVDLAAPRGSGVRAAADGYVAYVGFNPWDADERAFVVLVAHGNGRVTLYGHLQPTRKVRAGERVDRGDLIGFVGMTGTTSGPHVHWELWVNRTTVDPMAA